MTSISKIYALCILSLLLPIFAFDDVEKPVVRKYLFTSYLGCTETGHVTLAKKTFDSLVALPFCAKDSHMNLFPIQTFEITYAERGLYQDSAGLPIIFTDYSNVRCYGDTVPKIWVNIFKERSYKGDTVYIDNVKVRGNDSGKTYACKGMKIIIK